MTAIQLRDNLAAVEFNTFDLDAYALFLRCKKLPESQLAYSWQTDTYTLTTPARFAPMLGVEVPDADRGWLPLADHLFDYQRFVVDLALEAERVRAIYDPEENPQGWITTDEWIKWAHGVWDDIQETDVLDGYRSAREQDDERHVCPLQIEVIERLVKMYSNPGETVLDPFMGIGSTAWGALNNGRNAIGFELKESYHKQALANVAKLQRQLEERRHEANTGRQDLFSVAGIEVAAG